MANSENEMGLNNPYEVFVDDNFHFLDESERYSRGRFATLGEAIAVCKAIVDEFLEEHNRPGMTARDLYEGYVGFGEDPWISGPAEDGEVVLFSAWTYAKKRCGELCGGRVE